MKAEELAQRIHALDEYDVLTEGEVEAIAEGLSRDLVHRDKVEALVEAAEDLARIHGGGERIDTPHECGCRVCLAVRAIKEATSDEG